MTTVPGTKNLRDLGGLPATGGHVAPGRLLRAEALVVGPAHASCSFYDPAHSEAYRSLGLRTVLDLRTDREARRLPSAWVEATGATLVRIPFADGAGGADTPLIARIISGEVPSMGVPELGEYYIASFEGNAVRFAEALRLLARPEALPTLVHCAAGKDRTGLVVALVLEVLGTPRHLVVDDYVETGRRVPFEPDLYASLFATSVVPMEDVQVIFETPAEALEIALAHLDARYGGAAGYAREACGLSEDEIRSLTTNLVVAH